MTLIGRAVILIDDGCNCVDICAVNSVASSICSRHDPDVLRQEVAARKRHVQQLRRELEHMESEMQYAQHGVRALSLYDMSLHIRSIQYIDTFSLAALSSLCSTYNTLTHCHCHCCHFQFMINWHTVIIVVNIIVISLTLQYFYTSSLSMSLLLLYNTLTHCHCHRVIVNIIAIAFTVQYLHRLSLSLSPLSVYDTLTHCCCHYHCHCFHYDSVSVYCTVRFGGSLWGCVIIIVIALTVQYLHRLSLSWSLLIWYNTLTHCHCHRVIVNFIVTALTVQYLHRLSLSLSPLSVYDTLTHCCCHFQCHCFHRLSLSLSLSQTIRCAVCLSHREYRYVSVTEEVLTDNELSWWLSFCLLLVDADFTWRWPSKIV